MDAPPKATQPGTVVVVGNATGYAQEIVAGRHRLLADEPVAAAGTDTGPNPYDLLLSALGSCTSMTLGAYARRKGWPLESVAVTLRYSRVHADDCVNCETAPALLDRIDSDVLLVGSLSDDQRARLLEIATRCPVHRTLTSRIDIRTRLAGSDGDA